MLPDYAVVGSIKAKISDRFGIREEIGEQGAEFETKILVDNSFMQRSGHRAPDPPRRIDTHGCPPR
jgi:hypothetical protein